MLQSCLIFSNCSIISSWEYNRKCWLVFWLLHSLWTELEWVIELHDCKDNLGKGAKGWIYQVSLPPMTCRVWPQVQPTFFSICSLDFKGICVLFYGLHSERGWIQKKRIKPHHTCQQQVSWRMISSSSLWSLTQSLLFRKYCARRKS